VKGTFSQFIHSSVTNAPFRAPRTRQILESGEETLTGGAMNPEPGGGSTFRNAWRTGLWLGFALLVIVLVMGASAVFTIYLARRAQPSDLEAWAAFGQACGAFSAVVAVVALGAFVFTFAVQQREAKEHRVELQLQRQALADSGRELHCASETGLSMYHFKLLELSIANPHLAAVWPTIDPTLPIETAQQYLYCTLVFEGVWLNARAGRYDEADVRAAVTFLLTSPLLRQYWSAVRSSREMASAVDGPEAQYFRIVDEIYAATD